MSTHTFVLAKPVASTSLAFPATVGFYFASRLSISYLFFQSAPQVGAIFSLTLNLTLLLATAFYIFGSERQPASFACPPLRWINCFLAISCLSLLWSSTVSVPIAAGYWSGMAADVGIVILLLRYQPTQQAGHSLMRGYVLGACFIAMVAWLSPTMKDLRPGDDEFFSPNAIGFTCAFAVFLAQYLNRIEGRWKVSAIVLSISLLRTLSKTTIAAFVVAQAFLFFRDRSISRSTRLAVTAGTLAILALFWPLLNSYYTVYTNAGNQAETLTGRIGIWLFVLARSFEQPWTGHGFHSFRNVIPPFGNFEAWHAHNEIIQQFYAYGLVGIVMLLGLYISFYRYLRKKPAAARSIFASLLLFILIRGLGDTERFDLSFPLWAIALISITIAETSPMVIV